MSAIVQSITFRDEVTEIVYFEEDDATEFVFLAKNLIVDNDPVKVELAELVESAQDLLDAALVVKVNPPKRLRRKDRTLEPVPEKEEDESGDD